MFIVFSFSRRFLISLLIIYIYICTPVHSQTRAPEFKIWYTGKIINIQQGRSILRINEIEKQKLISSLRKGLTWDKINQSKNIRFKKSIASIYTLPKSLLKQPLETGLPDYILNLECVFESSNDTPFAIKLYSWEPDYIPRVSPTAALIFDIEKPGSCWLSLESRTSVEAFIQLINAKVADIDGVFK